VLLPPDLVPNFLEEFPEVVIGQSALFDLTAEGGEGLDRPMGGLDVPLDKQANMAGQVAPRGI